MAALSWGLVGCQTQTGEVVLSVRAPEDSGISFIHQNGAEGSLWPLEIMGSGAALIDFDNDGDLDIYLRQGGTLGEIRSAVGDRLYVNQWVETGAMRFRDGSAQSGVGQFGYGMGVATGDFDGDGWTDLFLTNYGPDILLRNNRGVFEVSDGPWHEPLWSTAATFLDFDRDNDLDLFVTRYIDFHPDRAVRCTAGNSRPDYCGPQSYQGLSDRLYENIAGRWRDVTTAAGLFTQSRAGLGAAAVDVNGDAWTDIMVANDADLNQLWINRGDGAFEDEGIVRGIAVNADGRTEASMGIALADIDGNGVLDVFMSHLSSETNTLYLGRSGGWYEDRTGPSGLGAPSRPVTGFGAGWLHLDDDTLPDLLVTNGAISIDYEQQARGYEPPLRQLNQAFLNRSDGRFELTAPEHATLLNTPMVGRAIALGDLDNDGDTDLVITENNGPARLVVNEQTFSSDWVGIRLLQRGESGGWMDALGARLDVEFADSTGLTSRYHSDGSYLAASDPRIIVRFIPQAPITRLTVQWPDGATVAIVPPPANTYTVVRKGKTDP